MQQNCASLAVLQKGTQLSLVLVITAQHEWPDSNVLCVPKEGACEELLGISPYPWKKHTLTLNNVEFQHIQMLSQVWFVRSFLDF